ncbi:lumazine-binding domain protein [Nocardiopsis sp. MG754419]|uniref:lumazine-binding domain protein n=1 Tax=Nocardiopsis sp. MG754419 TaxID=2259865 RepID=UPI001BAC03BE|nr:lumazine-binding domain protein [Nocardiopsis sp. MG754419]MBR8745063.1 lumazine-binding domain protein [Nocardiopsis sp. MG754419]
MRRVLLCSLPLALVLAACSGGEDETPADDTAAEEADAGGGADPEAAALTVAEGFVAALNSDDAEAACALIDESAEAAVIAQSEGAEDCVSAFPDYAENLPDSEAIEIGEVGVGTDLDGETEIVTVTLVHPDQDPGALEVRESDDGTWHATRIPGATLGGA